MQSDSGLTTSVWISTADLPTFSPLGQDLRADVCIVGAGMAGLTTAYLLSMEGKKVVVLDDGPITGGETCRTTAHLAFYLDDVLTRMERLHGPEGLKLAVQSHSAAVDRIESIVRAENIDCDFRRLDAYLFCGVGETEQYLEDELAAAHRSGITDAQFVDRAPIPGFESGRCIRFPRHGQFHPLKYLSALASAIQRNGGQIFNHTHAASIDGGNVATSSGHTITADATVVATNSPINDMFAIHTKQEAYRTYVIGVSIPAGYVTPALFWDTEDPYHYVRIQPASGHDILIVGGEDHKTGQGTDMPQRFEKLEEWARARFPSMQQVLFKWSGQVMEPIDGLAYIGRNPMDDDNVFIATGDSGMGMTHGTIAGILLTDLILNRPNPWTDLYDPSRKRVKAAGAFTSANVNVAVQYTDFLTPGEVKSPDEVSPDSGAVMRQGLSKLAIWKDKAGQTHTFSAICPHLGCILTWNGIEHSWDCPCHGSRFAPDGHVINGPANSNMKPA